MERPALSPHDADEPRKLRWAFNVIQFETGGILGLAREGCQGAGRSFAAPPLRGVATISPSSPDVARREIGTSLSSGDAHAITQMTTIVSAVLAGVGVLLAGNLPWVALLRANPLAPDAWIMAIVTGLVGFAGLLALVAVMARLATLPESAPIVAPTRMPRLTVFLLLVMSSIVAGVTEEAGFRGYI